MTQVVCVALLLAAAIAVVASVWRLWPDPDQLDRFSKATPFAAPGVTTPDAVVESVGDPCGPSAELAPPPGKDAAPFPEGPIPDDGGSVGGACGELIVRVASGADDGRQVEVPVPPEVMSSGIRRGDEVQVMRIPVEDGPAQFSFVASKRTSALLWMTGIFVLVVVLVGRRRGVLALVGLGLSGAVLVTYVLPALLEGRSPLAVGLSAAAGIVLVVLYLTHGLSWRTTTAQVGTLVGLVTTAAGAAVAVDACRLTGVIDESSAILAASTPALDFQALVTCGVVLAAVGVLNDVTITQTSAVWELRAAAPTATRRKVLAGGLRIGRDHIASVIYTIVFAYAGTALATLLLVQLYNRSLGEILSTQEISVEVVRTLASATALVLAVPITTAIAVLVAGPSHTPRTARIAASTSGPPPEARWLDEQRSPDEDFTDFWGAPRRQRRTA